MPVLADVAIATRPARADGYARSQPAWGQAAWRKPSRSRPSTLGRTGVAPNRPYGGFPRTGSGSRAPFGTQTTAMTYAGRMRQPGEQSGWERLFWLVFARTSNPIVLLDERRRIVDVNDSALSLLQRDRADAIGSSIVESVKPDERAASTREWRAFLRSGEYSGKRALVRADGSEVQIDFAARLETLDGRRLAIYVAMVEQSPASCAAARAPAPELGLTNREREVVTLIALGLETAEIAAELHISSETVRTHVRNAMSKLGARTRAQLVAIVLCRGHAVDMARLDA
jgi:PAS domain S-box-containing protein